MRSSERRVGCFAGTRFSCGERRELTPVALSRAADRRALIRNNCGCSSPASNAVGNASANGSSCEAAGAKRRPHNNLTRFWRKFSALASAGGMRSAGQVDSGWPKYRTGPLKSSHRAKQSRGLLDSGQGVESERRGRRRRNRKVEVDRPVALKEKMRALCQPRSDRYRG